MNCKCGCGKEVKNQYIIGHNIRINNPAKTDSARLKIKMSKIGIKFSDESRKKMSETRLRGNYSGVKAPRFGVRHTDVAKSKMSIKHKGKKLSEATKLKMSKYNSAFMTERILKNNGKHPLLKTYKHGNFMSEKNNATIPYDSSYELAAYKILEQLSKVKMYSRCNFSIDYDFNGRSHKYIPDILVTYDDESKDVIEIKPLLLIDKVNNPSKFEAASDYCNKNGLNFRIWTEKDININE